MLQKTTRRRFAFGMESVCPVLYLVTFWIFARLPQNVGFARSIAPARPTGCWACSRLLHGGSHLSQLASILDTQELSCRRNS